MKKPMYLNYKPNSDGKIAVWFIYLKIEDSTPILYGFTQKKSVYEEFKKLRNMDKFYVKKEKLTENEYYETFIADTKTDWIRYYMEHKKFYTSIPGKYYEVGEVDIICTGDEEMNVALRTDQVYGMLRKYTGDGPNSYYLKPDIQDILFFLKYHVFEGSISKIYNEEDRLFNDDLLEIDQFAVFVTLYGATLKEIGTEKIEYN